MTLGDQLFILATTWQNSLFILSSHYQLTSSSFAMTIQRINESPDPDWTLNYPLGIHPDGTIYNGTKTYKKEELIGEYRLLSSAALPLSNLYHLVTHCEGFFCHSLRAILQAYPQKLGQSKTIRLANLFEAKNLESLRMLAVEEFINELMYLSPNEYARKLQEIYSFNLLEIPAFHKYIEIKATRDIHIHNQGKANQIYLRKAGSHSRVQEGQFLPVNNAYFLNAFESCVQLSDRIREEFNKVWPSAEFEAYQNRIQQRKPEGGQLPPPTISNLPDKV